MNFQAIVFSILLPVLPAVLYAGDAAYSTKPDASANFKVTGPKEAINAYKPPASDSITYNFNPDWRQAVGSYPVETAVDSGWQVVSTPHTYHEEFAYFGYNKGLKDLGPHTYRKHFKLPAEFTDRQVFLEFEGIRQRGQFTLNGHFLGRQQNGVAPFGYDITSYLNFGAKENILQVEIDCSEQDWQNDTTMCWFWPGMNPLYGGICRNVKLHVMGKVHATLPLHSSLGTSGTYVYGENISTEKQSADVGIEVEVKNEQSTTTEAQCEAVIVNRDGSTLARLKAKSTTIDPGKTQNFMMHDRLKKLHFWQPDYPYLYDVYTVITVGGRVVDVQKVVTGFRKIEVRGSTLYLNNRALMTMGYTPRSQNEWPAIGNAYPDWLHDYSNKMMADGHARLVRWEHIMPSPQDVTSCDRVGLPQIMPGADRENDSVGREWELRKEIMRDTIIYCRNSPSIILWEAANNVLTREHNQEMIALRDRWDARGYRRPMGGRSVSPEWISWMYGVHKQKYQLSVDTEFMRDESPRRWWDAYSPPYFHKVGDWKLVDNAGGWNRNQDNMCVMQSLVYEQYYKARPGTGEDVCNGGVQIFFADGDSFTRGDDSFRRSGPVDGMRIPKDTYGCNKTLWQNTPELWTAGKPAVYFPGHWNYPVGTIKPVYVFASPGIAAVQLFVNGQKQKPGQHTNLFQFTFDSVAWQPGVIKAIGYDATGKPVAEMAHETAGAPVALKVKPICGPTGLRANGSDVALIETEIVDGDGRRCPLANTLIHYEVAGPAIWRGGIWEEDVPKYANKQALPALNGVHRVFVRSTSKPGIIQLKVSAEGLSPVTVSIEAKRVEIHDGLTREMPAIETVVLSETPQYGPDLPPAPKPPPGAFDQPGKNTSSTDETIIDLSVAFPRGVEIRHAVANGQRIYRDKDWIFSDLPDYLRGADYLMVANDDAMTSAGEGVVFRIGKAGRVYVAYDDANPHFPIVSSSTPFKKTRDKITIHGHIHTLYCSAAMNAGELTYLGSNNWADRPPWDANNYVVFVQTDSAKSLMPVNAGGESK